MSLPSLPGQCSPCLAKGLIEDQWKRPFMGANHDQPVTSQGNCSSALFPHPNRRFHTLSKPTKRAVYSFVPASIFMMMHVPSIMNAQNGLGQHVPRHHRTSLQNLLGCVRDLYAGHHYSQFLFICRICEPRSIFSRTPIRCELLCIIQTLAGRKASQKTSAPSCANRSIIYNFV